MLVYNDIMTELRSGKYRPIYLLMGEEPYYIDAVASFIEQNALSEADKVFNQTIFYGKDAKVVDIIHEAEQYPMMAERRLVIVKEAQELNTNAGDKAHFQDFAKYAEHLMESTILVLCYKYDEVDKRGKLFKTIDKVGCTMVSPKIWDDQMPAYVTQFVREQGLGIDPKAAELMAEHIGAKMSVVAATVEKLKIVCESEGLKSISVEMVTKHVGISNEYNILELRSALLMRNVAKVNRIVKVFGNNDKQYPIQMVVATLYGTFAKLFHYHYVKNKSINEILSAIGERSEFVIRKTYEPASRLYSAGKCLAIIGYLREYDLKSKGYNYPQISSGDALQELVFKILN
ncbi:MAG: DNA polymerase III subunit delta [Bacteroidales bacterium]|nr:DNA polymerase III subunit delta [Bacteroidales bacterium]